MKYRRLHLFFLSISLGTPGTKDVVHCAPSVPTIRKVSAMTGESTSTGHLVAAS